MLQASYHFPKGFLWGTATAAHQVEGSNTNNNWAAWEAQPGRIINGHTSGLACDWWGGRWREDFDRAVETHQNAHRLSVEWSRIQPKPDVWDEAALDFYRDMLRGLLERNLTPMVTLHHFTDPLWFSESGGWENPEAPALFEKFVNKTVGALKEYAQFWVTINEPNVYFLSGYVEGVFPPGQHDLKAAYSVLANLVRGHAAAYHAIHALQPHAKVGTAINYRSLRPARPGFPLDGWTARLLHNLYNHAFPAACQDGILRFGTKKERIPAALKTQDYIGVNYYTRDLVHFSMLAFKNMFHRRTFPPGAALSETGFLANVPEGMFEGLKWAKGFGLPIYVTENGVEDSTDTLRPRYLLEHLHQVWRAANFSWQIKGYFHWSLVDNFEWERGWTQRFGLWGLDVATRARIRRPSVDLYAEICRENGITSSMVERYAPQSFQRLFPT